MDGSTTLNTATLNGSGEGDVQDVGLLAGSHSITVVYSGDTNFPTSTSSAVIQTVNQAGTTSALALACQSHDIRPGSNPHGHDQRVITC